MIDTIIFDLSEVFISGLIGVDRILSKELNIPRDNITRFFGEDQLKRLCLGEITEQTYLETVLETAKWDISTNRLKQIIRQNFHNKMEGMEDLLKQVIRTKKAVLLSDHAREWVEYIEKVHDFMRLFSKKFFSFEIKGLKIDPQTFGKVISRMNASPEKCIFIDDHQENVDSAAQAGIQGIVFQNAVQLTDDLKSLDLL
jgi:putative hydrolase of the HAD superfamily